MARHPGSNKYGASQDKAREKAIQTMSKGIQISKAKEDIEKYSKLVENGVKERYHTYNLNEMNAYRMKVAEGYANLGDIDNELLFLREIIYDISSSAKDIEEMGEKDIKGIGWNFKKAHFLLAPYDFHYYLLCMEWGYPPESKFYANRYCVMREWAEELQNLEDGKYDILGLSAPPRSGKEQPFSAKVLTPSGWTTMEDIHVGSKVMAADGKIAEVTNVFYQGKKDVYRITFEDNTYAECGIEHLWHIQTGKDYVWERYRVVTLKDILQNPNEIYFVPISPALRTGYYKKRAEKLNKTIKKRIRISSEGEPYIRTRSKFISHVLAERARESGIFTKELQSSGKEYFIIFDFSKKIKKITKIEKVRQEECKCIYIDNPTHEYITDGYTVTHNTGIGCLYLTFCMGRHPEKSMIFVTHTTRMARKAYADVLRLINDPLRGWGTIFPGFKITESAEDLYIDVTPKPSPNNYATIYFTSIESNKAGFMEASHLIYLDDLIGGIEEALNPSRLETAWDKYTTDVLQRKNGNVRLLHIATRWSINDPLSREESDNENNPRAKFICVPGLNEKGESNFNFQYNPLTREHFEALRQRMDDISFSCIIQQRPVERDGLVFSMNDLSYYTELPDGEADEICFAADLAFGGGDYLVLVVAHVYNMDAYIHDVIFTNKTKDITKPLVVDCILRNKAVRGYMEANGGGDTYAADIDERLRERGYRCHIISRRAPVLKSKLARILDAQAEIKARITDGTSYNLHFLNPNAGARKSNLMYDAYLQQLCKFNQTAKFIGKQKDDAADATAMLVNEVLNRPNVSGKIQYISRNALGL